MKTLLTAADLVRESRLIRTWSHSAGKQRQAIAESQDGTFAHRPINDMFGHRRPLQFCFPVCQFLPLNLAWPICPLQRLVVASRTVYSNLYIGKARVPTCTERISRQSPSIGSCGSGCLCSVDRSGVWVCCGSA